VKHNTKFKSNYVAVLLIAISYITFSTNALAEVMMKAVSYKDGGTTLNGHLAWDTSHSGPRPGILVVDEWWGLTDWAKDTAKKLATAGYVAFAADMYGDGMTTNDPKTAGEWMKAVVSDEKLWSRRAQLGLDILKAEKMVDGSKLGAMGSSFGAATAMKMSYWGQDIKAAVSITTGMMQPPPEGTKSVKTKMLVFVGADDKSTAPEKIEKFVAGSAGIDMDYQLVVYSKTRHSFTTPQADSRSIPNLAYSKRADTRAWKAITNLFDEAFK
jgi:dienelactone hydrolase